MSSDELDEYLTDGSRFRRMVECVSAITRGGYPFLNEVELQKRLRFLSFKLGILEAAQSRGKDMRKEIPRTKTDMKELKVEAISALIAIKNIERERYSALQDTLNEFDISSPQRNQRLSDWDHLDPDPTAVISSLEQVAMLEQQLAEALTRRASDLQMSLGQLRELGVAVPSADEKVTDFSKLKLVLNGAQNTIDVPSVAICARAFESFYDYASKLSNVFGQTWSIEIPSLGWLKPRSSVFSDFLDRNLRTSEGNSVPVGFLLKLAAAGRSSAESLRTGGSIDYALKCLEDISFIVCEIKASVEGASAVLYALSQNDCVTSQTDYAVEYAALRDRIPLDISNIRDFTTMGNNTEEVVERLRSLGIETIECAEGRSEASTGPSKRSPPKYWTERPYANSQEGGGKTASNARESRSGGGKQNYPADYDPGLAAQRQPVSEVSSSSDVMYVCPKCRMENDAYAKFCIRCGASLAPIAPSRGRGIRDSANGSEGSSQDPGDSLGEAVGLSSTVRAETTASSPTDADQQPYQLLGADDQTSQEVPTGGLDPLPPQHSFSTSRFMYTPPPDLKKYVEPLFSVMVGSITFASLYGLSILPLGMVFLLSVITALVFHFRYGASPAVLTILLLLPITWWFSSIGSSFAGVPDLVGLVAFFFICALVCSGTDWFGSILGIWFGLLLSVSISPLLFVPVTMALVYFGRTKSAEALLFVMTLFGIFIMTSTALGVTLSAGFQVSTSSVFPNLVGLERSPSFSEIFSFLLGPQWASSLSSSPVGAMLNYVPLFFLGTMSVCIGILHFVPPHGNRMIFKDLRGLVIASVVSLIASALLFSNIFLALGSTLTAICLILVLPWVAPVIALRKWPSPSLPKYSEGPR